MPPLGALTLRSRASENSSQNHIDPTKGGSLVTPHEGGFCRRRCRARSPRERERGDEDRRHGHAAHQGRQGHCRSSSSTSTTSSRTGRRSTSATRCSSTRSGFHTVDLPKKGGKAARAARSPPARRPGLNDAAGNPFWFNGAVPQVGFNPLARQEQPRQDADATAARRRINSGLPPESGKPKPMTVKFTKAGTFAYYCDIHPGMKGSVKVVAKSKTIPSAKADAKTRQRPGRARPEDRQGAAQDNAGRRNGRRRRGRQARRRVLRHVPGDPDGPGRHDDEVPMIGQDPRGAHRDVRPRRPRDGAERLPRRRWRRLRCRPGVPGAGRLPERSAAGRSGGPDPDAARQRVLELRRSSTSTRRRRCRRRTR